MLVLTYIASGGDDTDTMDVRKEIKEVLFRRPPRGGVEVFVVRTQHLTHVGVDYILKWRAQQYQATGFIEDIEKEIVTKPNKDDIHLLALDDQGHIAAYTTGKRPANYEELLSYWFRDKSRPMYPVEQTHGRSWQRLIQNVDNINLSVVWEAGRFISDQSRKNTPTVIRAVLELGTTLAIILGWATTNKAMHLVMGDIDTRVALKNIQYLFLPVATFAEHHPELEDDDPYYNRYKNHQTTPFIATKDDMSDATYARLADIATALENPDHKALPILWALRSIVSLEESSLKRPLLPADDIWPIDAVLASHTQKCADTMWNAVGRGHVPWQQLDIPPGTALPVNKAVWSVRGQGRVYRRSKDDFEVIGNLPQQSVFLPGEQSERMDGLEVVSTTPVRALVAEPSELRQFMDARTKAFQLISEHTY